MTATHQWTLNIRHHMKTGLVPTATGARSRWGISPPACLGDYKWLNGRHTGKVVALRLCCLHFGECCPCSKTCILRPLGRPMSDGTIRRYATACPHCTVALSLRINSYVEMVDIGKAIQAELAALRYSSVWPVGETNYKGVIAKTPVTIAVKPGTLTRKKNRRAAT